MGVKNPYAGFNSRTVTQDTYIVRELEKTRYLDKGNYSIITIEPITIQQIPKAMSRMGWKRSASFMTRWLNSPAWKCPESWKDGRELPEGMYIPDQHCDDTTIKMSWLIGYPRVANAVTKLLNERALSPAALKMTAKRLKRLGWDGCGAYTFGRKNILGRPSMSARELEQNYQNNYLGVGDNFTLHLMWDTLDDVFGSLGTFSLKVGVIGTAYSDSSKNVFFEPSYAGVYVKDFYDFNNDNGWDQPLGVWTEDGILTRGQSVISIPNIKTITLNKKTMKCAYVFNSDFLKYRDKTGRGGDFIVFSDVYWVRLSGVYPLPWG
ncbi:hypothetical protein IBT49_07990 [Erwinia sp. S63]|uniref:DUF6402 family protein n=1 Tax=Erwinia sp. S63 TaxID=2769341 RepID=UPI00190A2C2F|nr:DUF6402 family protein [Erwinia sp. S63]MBK0095914.1 hypothetical protein [Erwinia sp. S63]